MFEVGRLVMKIAGRDAGKVGVVVSVVGNTLVIDGQVRRRKVNVKHVYLLDKDVKVSEGASFDEVAKALKAAGFECRETKKKDKTKRPKKVRKKKVKPKKEKKSKTKPKEKPKKEEKAKETKPKETKKEESA